MNLAALLAKLANGETLSAEEWAFLATALTAELATVEEGEARDTRRAELLADLDGDALGALETGLRERADALLDGDPSHESNAELAAIADGLDALEAENAARTEAVAALEAEREANAARIRGEQQEGEGEGGEGQEAEQAPAEGQEGQPAEGQPPAEGGEGSGAPAEGAQPTGGEGQPAQPEAVAAAATPTPRTPARPPLRHLSSRRPSTGAPRRPRSDARSAIVAAGGLGYNANHNFADLDELSEALLRTHESFRRSPMSGRHDVLVASIEADYPAERRITEGMSAEQIEELFTDQVDAVVAAGGICAPPQPVYDLPMIAGRGTPVEDALPGVQTPRGGIIFTPPVGLPDFSTAGIRVTTAAQDLAGYTSTGGSTADKPCARVTCDAPATVSVAAISNCLTFGNFQARSYPEHVREYTDLSLVAGDRTSEEFLLAQLVAGSTAVTGDTTYGASRDLLMHVSTLVAAYRSRHRTPVAQRFRAAFPTWVREMLRTDVANSLSDETDTFAVADAMINEWFAVRGIDPIWYLDESNPGGGAGTKQVYGAQAAGIILQWKTLVRWFLWPEGTWVLLDAGTLDIGLVRDSALNATNDFSTFTERFLNVAKRGFQSLVVDSTIVPNGSSAAGVAPNAGPLP